MREVASVRRRAELRGRLRRRRFGWFALLATSLAAAPVHALPAWDLLIGPGDMQNNFNVPKITLTNTSTAGEQIVEFRMSIGHPNFLFDFVADLSSNPAGRAANVATEALTGATLTVGNRINGVGAFEEVAWSFSDFQVGEALVFEVDVDPHVGGPTVDARTVFFDNGAHPNSVVLVRFSDGSMDTLVLPDAGAPSAGYSFGGTGSPVVPEPSVALLIAAGLAALRRVARRAA